MNEPIFYKIKAIILNHEWIFFLFYVTFIIFLYMTAILSPVATVSFFSQSHKLAEQLPPNLAS